MAFEYEIKGIKLSMVDMCQINRFYEAACTAECLIDNENIDEEDALKFGYDIHRLMDKYGYPEDEAMNIVLKDWRKDRWMAIAEELAWKIREVLLKHEMWIDTHIYFNGKCLGTSDKNGNFGYNDADKIFLMENEDPRNYFEYVSDIVSMSFEGPLYDAINYDWDSPAVKELNELFDSYGLYMEQGNAWNAGIYEA